jgi:hypothetical protein
VLNYKVPTPATSRVVDPYSFFPDPDPDPEFEAGDQSGSGPIRIQGFNDQKLKYSWKKIYFSFIKNCNLPIPRPP